MRTLRNILFNNTLEKRKIRYTNTFFIVKAKFNLQILRQLAVCLSVIIMNTTMSLTTHEYIVFETTLHHDLMFKR